MSFEALSLTTVCCDFLRSAVFAAVEPLGLAALVPLFAPRFRFGDDFALLLPLLLRKLADGVLGDNGEVGIGGPLVVAFSEGFLFVVFSGWASGSGSGGCFSFGSGAKR